MENTKKLYGIEITARAYTREDGTVRIEFRGKNSRSKAIWDAHTRQWIKISDQFPWNIRSAIQEAWAL